MGMLFTAALVLRHHPSTTEVLRPRVHGHTTRHGPAQYSTTSPTETGRARHVPHQQNKAVEVQYPQAVLSIDILEWHHLMHGAPDSVDSKNKQGSSIPGTGKYKSVQYGARTPIPGACRRRGIVLVLSHPSSIKRPINFTETRFRTRLHGTGLLSNSPFWRADSRPLSWGWVNSLALCFVLS